MNRPGGIVLMFLGLDKVEWIQVASALGTVAAAMAAWKSSNAAKTSADISQEIPIKQKLGGKNLIFI